MDIQKLLDELLRRGLDAGCYPGAVAACGVKGKTLAVSCAGVTALGGKKVNEQTRYDMASLTKVLSPTMIAFQALENGIITLYDTLDYWFPKAPEDKKEITVFQLMTHIAGFIPSFRLDKTVPSPDKALDAILKSELVCAPGTQPNYSCMGYIVLGKILEKAYGKPLNVLAEEMVFGPLGMKHTGYLPEGGNIAATEVDPETGKAWCGVVHDENARFLGGVSANAGVFSDINDMLTFCRMLSLEGDGFISRPLLKKATVCYTDGFDVHRGLGFHLGGTEYNYMGDLFPACSFGHTGFTGTSAAVDPTTGFYVILLSNRVHPTRESDKLFRFRRSFHNALYACFSKYYQQ